MCAERQPALSRTDLAGRAESFERIFARPRAQHPAGTRQARNECRGPNSTNAHACMPQPARAHAFWRAPRQPRRGRGAHSICDLRGAKLGCRAVKPRERFAGQHCRRAQTTSE